MFSNKKLKLLRQEYNKSGYLLMKNFVNKKECAAALKWMNSKNHNKLANTWTEQEPGVPLAVYFVVHKGNSPISKIARKKKVLDFATVLAGEKTYIYSSKVNIKAPWCGAVEYFHQDLVYWRDRGYPRDDMLSAMVFLEPHNMDNAPLHLFPGSHKKGFIKHQPFININGLSKFMIPPKKLDNLKKKYGYVSIKAEPGDVLFFHMGIVHGSSHNIGGNSRMVVLSQLNTIGNIPKNVNKNAKKFNLLRAKNEYIEAQRKLKFFKKKYFKQLKSKKLTFSAPIAKQER